MNHPDAPSNAALESYVERAQRGDQRALKALVGSIQDQVYGLSLRMLVHPEEALNASQEILILVITKLSTFERRARFRTWVHRVAINYLLGQVRKPTLSFAEFEEDLATGQTEPPPETASDQVLLNEVRVACTMAMLLCLDADHRAAYVLGEILELDHHEASSIVDVSPANFRKRLSRARKAVFDFTSKACGLANDQAACHCSKRVGPAIEQKRIRPGIVLYSQNAPAFDATLARAREVSDDLRALKLQRSTGQHSSPKDFRGELSRLLERTN